jgi:hypothetical protein
VWTCRCSCSGEEDFTLWYSLCFQLLWCTFILHGVIGNMLVFLGLVGNTLSIVVLCNRRMRSSTSYYLTSLAVYDNFILMSLILFFNVPGNKHSETDSLKM